MPSTHVLMRTKICELVHPMRSTFQPMPVDLPNLIVKHRVPVSVYGKYSPYGSVYVLGIWIKNAVRLVFL